MAKPINWQEADDQILQRIVTEAETLLKGMLTSAVSMDQRSATLGGIFIATATAISGLVLVYVTGKDWHVPLVVGGLISIAMFVCASIFCIHATIPVEFYIAGQQPKKWYSTVLNGTSYKEALGEDLGNYQKMITADALILNRAGMKLRCGARFGIAAPVVGTTIALASLFFA